MSFLRDIGRDLVDKRLWPVAVLLVGGIIALVVVASSPSSGSDATASVPVLTATGGPAAAGGPTSEITVDTSQPKRLVSRAGKVRDPFKQLHLAKVGATGATGAVGSTRSAAKAAGTGSTGASGGSGGSAGSAGSAGTTGSTGTTGTTGTTTAPTTGSSGATGTTGPPPEFTTYRVALRFAEAGKRSRIFHDVARLTPLPEAENPFFVFLGVLSDEKTSVFLISSDVTATGDGKCRPSASDCETIELKAGDTEFFDLSTDGGKTVRQYQIDLLKVVKNTTTDAARAAKAHKRESSSGRAAVRAAHDVGELPTDGYHYLPACGVLIRDVLKVKVTKHVPTTATKSAWVPGRTVPAAAPPPAAATTPAAGTGPEAASPAAGDATPSP